ncbi:MAG: SPASM domain-containing protein [Clostridia bacterium]|nr:SPASM domain-containing protein [Clostridia bacterium]
MKQLSVLIKPASSLCNMRCRYCFYADVSEQREICSYGVMSEEVMKTLILRVKESGAESVVFAFQGGEPTLCGLSYYEAFVKEVGAVLPCVKVDYSIQTNGLLLDDAFCAFLKENRFLVGLSLDGFRENHNAFRPDAAGKDSFTKTLAAADRLKRYGVDFNILTVVTAPLAKRAEKLWRFYQKNRFDFVQLIPCLAPLSGDAAGEWALAPKAYADFLKALFPLWVDALTKEEYISVRLFDNLVRQAYGQMPEMCGMCGVCSPQFVIEADGGVYPCDFYVLDEYRCGSLLESSFEEILRDERMQSFLKPQLPEACATCRFARFCRGGCKRYRSFYLAKEGYCPYADFLSSCEKDILRAGRFVFGR